VEENLKKVRWTFLLSFMILLFALTSCGSSALPEVVGTWELQGVVVEFHSDNTGREIYEGQEATFTWNIRGSELKMDFIEGGEISPINELLNMVVHGVAIGSFQFSLSEDGRVLSLSDNHDHGHFVLEFERLD